MNTLTQTDPKVNEAKAPPSWGGKIRHEIAIFKLWRQMGYPVRGSLKARPAVAGEMA